MTSSDSRKVENETEWESGDGSSEAEETQADPVARVMDLIFGRWRSQVLYAGVELDIFEQLEGGSKTADELAEELDLHPDMTYRLMRALASLGLLDEKSDHRFALTESGRVLTEDHPATLRGITRLEEGPTHYRLWKHLPDIVAEGRPNGFQREFGHSGFEHRQENPEYARVFNDAMTSYSKTESTMVLEALEGYDFSRFDHICDVGGGFGHLLCSLLRDHPSVQGTVLEVPGVVEEEDQHWAEPLGVEDRVEFVAGDMFEEVPSADAYLMKHILHDWNDEECVQILDTMGRAAPDNARVFVAEFIVPGQDQPHFSKMFDIHMMVWGTGKERTVEEYTTLFERAGWKFEETWYPPSGMMGVVEGVRG